jgi:hypothetical protein
MKEFNKTGRVRFNEKSQSFDYPTPLDDRYEVGADHFQSVPGLLAEVCHLRDKHGTSDEQLVDLLCCAAAVID